MQEKRGNIYRAVAPFAVGALLGTIAIAMLPLAGRTPELTGTLLTVGIFALIPLVTVVAAALGERALRRTPGGQVGDGAIAGLIVGTGVLLGGILGLAALGWIAGHYPEVQQLVRNSEPHPEARLPYDRIAPLGAAAGALIGFLAGLVYLVMAILGGLLSGVLRGPIRPAAAPRPIH